MKEVLLAEIKGKHNYDILKKGGETLAKEKNCRNTYNSFGRLNRRCAVNTYR